MIRRDVFQAIADPGRRAIIALLAVQSMTVNEVAAHFDISRPAVSKHVRILTECGLVAMRNSGRERYCDLQPKGLREVADWAGQYRQFWNEKLDALGTFLDADHPAVEPKLSSPKHKAKRT